MKFITLFTLCFVTLVFGQYSPTYVCDWQGSPYSYDLSPLYRSQGNAYAAKDDEGNVIYFNICGSLENLEEASLGCNPSGGACFVSATGTAITIGRPKNSIEVDDGVVEVDLPNGDPCSLSYGAYTTTVYLTCGDAASDGTQINFVNITYSTCHVDIYGTSPIACGISDSPSTTSSSQFVPAPILLGFVALFCCSACLCVCACHRRRRCRQQAACKRGVELNAVAYQPVPQQQQPIPQPQPFVQVPRPQPVVQRMPQMPVPITAPYVPMAPMQHPGMVPQHFQPVPPVYFNQPYFAYPQQPQPQPQPQFAFAPPLAQANNNVVVARENQLTEDERIARELQAKFDNE